MANNPKNRLLNIEMLQFVATKLGDLCNEVVFLGGCTTGLFVTDKAVPDIRYTLDVGCLVDIITRTQYHKLENKLRKLGFKQSLLENVICRWYYGDMILDVMPTDDKILGFSNLWYKDAIQYSTTYALSNATDIRIVTAPYFLATKLEAFKSRGRMDFLASHDFEDIISLMDGRLELIDEIKKSSTKLKKYLTTEFFNINNSRHFHDALPGHFIQYGQLADERIKLLLQRIEILIK